MCHDFRDVKAEKARVLRCRFPALESHGVKESDHANIIRTAGVRVGARRQIKEYLIGNSRLLGCAHFSEDKIDTASNERLAYGRSASGWVKAYTSLLRL